MKSNLPALSDFGNVVKIRRDALDEGASARRLDDGAAAPPSFARHLRNGDAVSASRVQAKVDYPLDAFAANESPHGPLKALNSYGA
jgi:hypothetical protein